MFSVDDKKRKASSTVHLLPKKTKLADTFVNKFTITSYTPIQVIRPERHTGLGRYLSRLLLSPADPYSTDYLHWGLGHARQQNKHERYFTDHDGFQYQVHWQWDERNQPKCVRLYTRTPYFRAMWYTGGKELVSFYFQNEGVRVVNLGPSQINGGESADLCIEIRSLNAESKANQEELVHRLASIRCYLLCGPLFKVFRKMHYLKSPIGVAAFKLRDMERMWVTSDVDGLATIILAEDWEPSDVYGLESAKKFCQRFPSLASMGTQSDAGPLSGQSLAEVFFTDSAPEILSHRLSTAVARSTGSELVACSPMRTARSPEALVGFLVFQFQTRSVSNVNSLKQLATNIVGFREYMVKSVRRSLVEKKVGLEHIIRQRLLAIGLTL